MINLLIGLVGIALAFWVWKYRNEAAAVKREMRMHARTVSDNARRSREHHTVMRLRNKRLRRIEPHRARIFHGTYDKDS